MNGLPLSHFQPFFTLLTWLPLWLRWWRVCLQCGRPGFGHWVRKFPSVQFSSVVQSYLTLCKPVDCSMPGFPVHHQLEACSNSCPSSRWCHPTISSSVVPFSSCLQSFPVSGSFLKVSSSHQVAKVLEFQVQHQSFQRIFRSDFL